MSVLVVFEHRAGKWNRMSFEALNAGLALRDVFGDVYGVAVGHNIGEIAAEASR